MKDQHIPWALWAVIIVFGVAVFWYYGRKKD